MRVTQDGGRYFHKTWDCENGGDLNTCDITSNGDATLLREGGGAEGVYGSSFQVRVIYLSEPAPAGSYTAYKAYAPKGLPAGYHIRPARAQLGPELSIEECLQNWPTRALDETNRLHGTNYDILPEYWDESGPHVAPDEVIADYQRISARLEMEACPLDKLIVPDVPTGNDLNIDLMADWNGWDLVNAPWVPLPENMHPE